MALFCAQYQPSGSRRACFACYGFFGPKNVHLWEILVDDYSGRVEDIYSGLQRYLLLCCMFFGVGQLVHTMEA